LIEEKKEGNEPFSRLLRRFNRRIQSSGILTEARNKRYFEKKPTRRKRREAAKRRAEIKKQREKSGYF